MVHDIVKTSLLLAAVVMASLTGTSSEAVAQSCNGQFQPGQVCNNPGGSLAPPIATFNPVFGNGSNQGSVVLYPGSGSAAPSPLQNGELWTNTVGVFARINGSTVGPFVGGGGGGGGTTNYIPIWTGATSLGNSIIYQSSSGGVSIGNTTDPGTANLNVTGSVIASGTFATTPTYSVAPTTFAAVFTPPSGNNGGLLINQTLTGTTNVASTQWNSINCTDNFDDTGAHPANNCFAVNVRLNGTSVQGGRQAFASTINLASPTSTALSNTLQQYVAVVGSAVASSGDNGISMEEQGTIYASNFIATVFPGGSYLYEVTAGEDDILVLTPDAPGRIAGRNIALVAGHATHARVLEGGLVFGAGNPTVGWMNGILFSCHFNDVTCGAPIATSGTIFATEGSWTVANAIDFSSITISTCSFKLIGQCEIDGVGRIQPGNYTGSFVANVGQIYTNVGSSGLGLTLVAVNNSSLGTYDFSIISAAGTLVMGVPTTTNNAIFPGFAAFGGLTTHAGAEVAVYGELYAQGADSGSVNYTFIAENSSNANLFLIRNDGAVAIPGSLTVSGAIIDTGGLSVAGALSASGLYSAAPTSFTAVITPPSGLSGGLIVNQTISGTSNVAQTQFNQFNCTDTFADTGGHPGNNCLAVNVKLNGTTVQGGRQAFSSVINLASPSSTAGSNTLQEYVAITGFALASSADNGNMSAPQGTMYGLNTLTQITSAATFMYNATSAELDLLVSSALASGSQAPARLSILNLVTLTGHGAHAANPALDGGLVFGAGVGGIGMLNGILFSCHYNNVSCGVVIDPAGTLMATEGSWTVNNGIDLSPTTITTCSFKIAYGCIVDGSGNSSVRGLIVGSAGFSATGAIALEGGTSGSVTLSTQATSLDLSVSGGIRPGPGTFTVNTAKLYTNVGATTLGLIIEGANNPTGTNDFTLVSPGGTSILSVATGTINALFGGAVAVTGNLTTNVTGSTQCVQASSTGVLSGTGSACGSGSGAVNSVTNSDGTLTITPTTGAVVASIALGHANTWTGTGTWTVASTVASATGANLNDFLVAAATTTITGTTLITTLHKSAFLTPTFTDGSAVTVNDADTVYIAAAPVAAGSVTITRAWSLRVASGATNLQNLTLGAALTYGGVTLNNAVTGTGNMVLATAPTMSAVTVTGSFTATGLVTNADLVNASTTVNGQTCTLGSTCTISASAGTITVGTTTIASGVTQQLLYDNAGTLGEVTKANNSVLVSNGTGVPSWGTTLPSGLSAASFTVTTAFTATGLVTNADLVNPSTTVNGQTCTLGSTCTISASAGTITIGVTTIASGTNGNVLFNNAGTLGEKTPTGTGNVVLASAPTIASLTVTTAFTATGLVTNAALANPSTTVNGVTCTLGSTCTISASAGTITVGVTTIASGATQQLLYDNAGALGEVTKANNSVLVSNGTGVPSWATTLPSGLSAPSLTVTTAFTATGLVTLADLATQTSNTVLGNATAGSASPTALAVGSCSTAASALIWTTNTGFGCNTAIQATTANPSASVGLTAVNGSATTAMRSDGAPALSQAITPVWSGQHIFTANTEFGANLTPDSLLEVNSNTVNSPGTLTAGTVLHINGTSAARLLVDTYAGGGNLSFRRSETTGGSAVAAFTPIGLISAFGWANGAYTTGANAQILMQSLSAWTASDTSTLIDFKTTPVASTAIAQAMRINSSGGVSIGTSPSDPGTGNLGFGSSFALFSVTTNVFDYGVTTAGQFTVSAILNTGQVRFGTGSFAANVAQIYTSIGGGGLGLVVEAANNPTGTNDFTLVGPGGTSILSVATGTINALFGGAVRFGTGSFAANVAQIYTSIGAGGLGLIIEGANNPTGTNDFSLVSPGGTSIIAVPTGTVNASFNGLIIMPNLSTDTAATTTRTVCQNVTGTGTANALYFGSGTAGVCKGTSARYMKTDIAPISYGLTEVMKTDVHSFRWLPGWGHDGDLDKTQVGFIADEVGAVMPLFTTKDRNGIDASVDYMGTMMTLFRSVQQIVETCDAAAAANDNFCVELKKRVGR